MIFSAIFNLLAKLFFFTGRIERNIAFKKPLSINEEKECFELMKLGDKHAEEKLVAHNLRLVAHIVKKYSKSGYDTDELISVGSIGLLKAVRSYNLNNGNNFSTYASKCITNEILMMFRADKKRLGDVSLECEIASDKDGNSVRVQDVIPASCESLEERTEANVLVSNIVKIMKEVLSEREYKVMELRYGIGGNVPLTQNEIAQKLGISRSYISRIETNSLKVIRGKMKDNI